MRVKSQNAVSRTVLNHLHIHTKHRSRLVPLIPPASATVGWRQALREPSKHSTHGTLITSIPCIFTSSFWLPFHAVQRQMEKFSAWKLNQWQYPIIFLFTAQLLPSTNLIKFNTMLDFCHYLQFYTTPWHSPHSSPSFQRVCKVIPIK